MTYVEKVTPHQQSGDFSVEPPVHGLVDVGGYCLHARLSGAGPVTVVCESGGGGTLEDWAMVEARVGQFACVMAYDRAGTGRSDPLPALYPGRAATRALRALLKALGVASPLVLVGHSLGEHFARGYTVHYPDDVAGLVLLDPRDAHFYEQLVPFLPLPSEQDSSGLSRLRAITHYYTGGELKPPAMRPGETTGFWRTVHDLVMAIREDGNLGNRPLEVLVRGVDDLSSIMTQDLPVNVARAWRALDSAGGRNVAGLSTRGRLTVVDGGGHNLPQEQPEVVAQAIRRVVKEVEHLMA